MLVYKIIIWGTGDEYHKLYNIVKYEELKKNIEIVAIVDKNKWQRKLDGYPVIFPKEVLEYEYDFIVVSSSKYYLEIIDEAVSVGVKRECLIHGRILHIPCFDFADYVALRRNPVSIISDDCWGGRVYHYLDLRMDSPFINLYILNDDFLRLICDFSYYIKQPLCMEEEGTNLNIPLGSLGEGEKKIYLHFNHAYSFDEAKLDFERRRSRIHRENLFVKMQYGWGKYSENNLDTFDKTPFNKKVYLSPFMADCKSLLIQNEYMYAYQRKDVEKYGIDPRDYKAYSQKIELLAKEYNILKLLTSGNVISRSIEV